jgi:hypothetical protein
MGSLFRDRKTQLEMRSVLVYLAGSLEIEGAVACF